MTEMGIQIPHLYVMVSQTWPLLKRIFHVQYKLSSFDSIFGIMFITTSSLDRPLFTIKKIYILGLQ